MIGMLMMYYCLQFICSYVLYPFAWVMGTPTVDCRQVASLIGIKTFTNEFIAYKELADLTNNRMLIQGWQAKGSNHTVMFDDFKNCYNLRNETYASDCLEMISVSSKR